MVLILYKEYFDFPEEFLKYENVCIKKYFEPSLKERDSYEAVFILNGENFNVSPWVGTPHLRVPKDCDELKSELEFFLGIPEPLEIERKFLVKKPDLDFLYGLNNCSAVEITQTYIEPFNKERFRVRKRGSCGNFTYFHTVKKHISGMKRIEEERIITEKEYIEFLNEAGAKKLQISKTRYCLLNNGKYFEIDVFPFWKDKAYVEIELKSESEEVSLPSFIEIIKEVTEDKSYTNFSLAKIYGTVI